MLEDVFRTWSDFQSPECSQLTRTNLSLEFVRCIFKTSRGAINNNVLRALCHMVIALRCFKMTAMPRLMLRLSFGKTTVFHSHVAFVIYPTVPITGSQTHFLLRLTAVFAVANSVQYWIHLVSKVHKFCRILTPKISILCKDLIFARLQDVIHTKAVYYICRCLFLFCMALSL